MTKNAKKLLDFLRKYIEKNKISPNYEEMKEHMGLKSKSSIFQYLEYLEEQGHIKKDKLKHTLTLELVKTPDILEYISNSKSRPKLVIGFSAETEKLEKNSIEKL